MNAWKKIFSIVVEMKNIEVKKVNQLFKKSDVVEEFEDDVIRYVFPKILLYVTFITIISICFMYIVMNAM